MTTGYNEKSKARAAELPKRLAQIRADTDAVLGDIVRPAADRQKAAKPRSTRTADKP
jgi:hypothetical protein